MATEWPDAAATTPARPTAGSSCGGTPPGPGCPLRRRRPEISASADIHERPRISGHAGHAGPAGPKTTPARSTAGHSATSQSRFQKRRFRTPRPAPVRSVAFSYRNRNRIRVCPNAFGRRRSSLWRVRIAPPVASGTTGLTILGPGALPPPDQHVAGQRQLASGERRLVRTGGRPLRPHRGGTALGDDARIRHSWRDRAVCARRDFRLP